ncbi:MAG: ADOP family duplicated permease [Terriglobia bacterium]
MSIVSSIRTFLAFVFRRSNVEREMEGELRLHLRSRADDLERQGLSRAEAERQARIEFGGYQRYKEECREALGTRLLGELIADVRHGLRQLRRNPGFTAIAVLTLALGIGANTAIFTVIDALILRMLPIRDPQQLVAMGNPIHVHSWSNGTPRTDIFSYPLYCQVRDYNTVFSSVLASSHIDSLQITIDGGAEKARGRLVTGNYFQTLGIEPLLGRMFTGTEDRVPGSDPFVVLSYDYWRDRFAGDPAVIGRTVHLNNYPFTIIGVAPPGFSGEVVGDRADLWVPVTMEPQLLPGRDFLETPDISTLLLMGRLRPGVTLAQARENVDAVVREALTETLSARMSADDRDAMRSMKFNVEVSPGGRGLSRLREEFSTPLLLLMGLVGVVLLVACVNVANLMLARSATRRREFAVRLALGAGPGRIVRQVLTEAILLSGLGGALGLLMARWGSAALVGVASRESTKALALGLDWRVLAFAAAVCLISGLLFGLVPALQFLKPGLDQGLREGDRSAKGGMGRMGEILVSLQIGLGVLVLIAAGLLVRSLQKLQDVNLGYSRDRLVLARVDLVASGYKGPEILNKTRELLNGLASVPGVRSVTASSNGLFSGDESSDNIRIEGFNPAADLHTADDEVGPDYFSTIGVPILLGREINQQDFQSGARVAVVNESFAKFYFGARNPLGRMVYIADSEYPGRPPYEIVGVARDVHDHGVRAAVRRRFYAPLSSAAFDDDGAPNIELRVVGNPRALIGSIRTKIHALAPNVIIDSLETGGNLVTDTLTSQVLVAKLSAFFAALVLALLCVGLYGTLSYRVAERTREIGIRMALGARRQDVLWMVVREVCVMLVVGSMAGIAGGIAATRLFQSMLYGVGTADPVSIATAIITLVATSLAAAIVPARRATKVDPMVALRYE